MTRKWSILGLSMATFAALTVGVTTAADDESPLHVLMEKVSATNNQITRTVRTKVTFAKADNGKGVAKDAEELTKLAKEAREIKDAVKTAKDVPNADKAWVDLMDAFIKSSQNLVKAAEGGDQAAAKKAHQAVKTSCADCHKVFRIEDEDF